MKYPFLILTVFLLSLRVLSQTNEPDTWLLEQKLPEWFVKSFKMLRLEASYKLSDFINPFYIEADFNGDNKTDIAVVIEQVASKKKGILVIHQQVPKYYVIAAGKDFGNGGDNFDWMDVWKVYSDKKIGAGVGEAKTVDLKTKAIYVAKSESSSAVIYWTGDKYRWHHQGD